ncbi:MAG: CopG family antitoxin [Candidatus Dormibacteria bacterium]|jgi:predicted DNA binding CopG/RHH family protein
MTARRREADETILSAQHFHDPYDAMSDDDFDAYMRRLFDQPQGPTRSVTVRMPEALLLRLQHMAAQRHMPYQRLMKRMLEESVSGLERRASTSTISRRTKPKPPT